MILLLLSVLFLASNVSAIGVVYKVSDGSLVEVGYADTSRFKDDTSVNVDEVSDDFLKTKSAENLTLADFSYSNGKVLRKSQTVINQRKSQAAAKEKVLKIISLKKEMEILDQISKKESDQNVLVEIQKRVEDITERIQNIKSQ